jgi:hypothetical protein
MRAAKGKSGIVGVEAGAAMGIPDTSLIWAV